MSKEIEKVTETKKEIVINDVDIPSVKELPLVVELPKTASEAQKQYAKLINAYAYQNPEKFALKKESMLKKLKSLEGKAVKKKTSKLKIKKQDSPVPQDDL